MGLHQEATPRATLIILSLLKATNASVTLQTSVTVVATSQSAEEFLIHFKEDCETRFY